MAIQAMLLGDKNSRYKINADDGYPIILEAQQLVDVSPEVADVMERINSESAMPIFWLKRPGQVEVASGPSAEEMRLKAEIERLKAENARLVETFADPVQAEDSGQQALAEDKPRKKVKKVKRPKAKA